MLILHGCCSGSAQDARSLHAIRTRCTPVAADPHRMRGCRTRPAQDAGPLQPPAHFARPLQGFWRSGPVCGAFRSFRTAVAGRTGKSRSSCRVVAGICTRCTAVPSFACISLAKRVFEGPFPVRVAIPVHFERAGAGKREDAERERNDAGMRTRYGHKPAQPDATDHPPTRKSAPA